MKRLSLCVFVVCAACLLLAPVALAATKSHSPARVRHATAAPCSYARLGVDPTYAISGRVLDINGATVSGAEVDWGWFDSSTGFSWGGTNMPSASSTGTAADGKFAFPAVGGHPGNDYLDVYYPYPGGDQATDWLGEMCSWSLDFSTDNDATLPAGYSYEMRPGQVHVTIANAPTNVAFPMVKVGDADTPGYALTYLALNGGGMAGVLPPQFNDVVASYPSERGVLAQVEAIEPSPVPVAAGATATDTVALDWSNAQYAYLAGPLCRHSGKAGSTVKMALKGWPAGETADLYAGPYHRTQLSAGPTLTYLVPLKVAATMSVGPYEIDTFNAAAASFLALSDTYQVCTFKPSVSSIRRGHAVRLSGKVWGRGNVTIYSITRKVSAQPSTLAAKGWHKVRAYKTSSGKFITGSLRPSRTTWYVAKYTGFAFPAFTSVIKVTVR